MKNQPRLVVMLFVMTVLLALLAAVQADYFLLDDRVEIEQKLDGRYDFSTLNGWRELLSAPAAGPTGRPLSVLSFALQSLPSTVLDATQFKLVNVLLHAIAALLLYGWLRALRRHGVKINAELCSCIWLILPIHVSTVLYPVQRMTQLATIFVLAGLWMYTHCRSRWARDGADSQDVVRVLLWIAVVGLCALLGKENGILLFWLIPLVEWFFFRAIWSGNDSAGLRTLTAVLLLAPLFAVPLFSYWLGMLEGYEARPFDLLQRLFTEARILWHYVGWTVLPTTEGLGLFHDDIVLSKSLLSPLTTAIALIAWGAVLLVAVSVRSRYPVLGFSVLFFMIAHSLESTFLPLELIFEHRNYLPSIGIAILVSCLLGMIARTVNARMNVVNALYLLPVVFVLCARLWIWSDEGRFYEHEARRQEGLLRAQYVYAEYLQRHAQVLGPDKRLAVLSTARSTFLGLKEEHPQSLLPCAGGYLLDTRWFPGNPQESEWLECIARRVGGATVSRVERNAFVAALARAIDVEASGSAVIDLVQSADRFGIAPMELAILTARNPQLSEDLSTVSVPAQPSPQSAEDYAVKGFLALERAQAESSPAMVLTAARDIYSSDERRQFLSALLDRLGR